MPTATTGFIDAQPVDGHVVVAGAIADAVAAAVEGGSGTIRMSGATSGASSFGSRMPQTPVQRLAERVGPHDQRLAAAGHHRQRKLRAGVRKLAHQRQRIDLGLERREARHDRAGLDRNRERPRRDRLGRGLPLGGGQRVAPRERGLAQIGFAARRSNGVVINAG